MSNQQNDIYYENLAELSQERYTDTLAYKNQLRLVWLNMVKNYGYDIFDYTEACERAGILVF
jgi:hypothetical protein